MKILVLNAGSSSQKSCLYDLTEEKTLPKIAPTPIWEASIDWTVLSGFGILKVKTEKTRWETKLEADNKVKAIASMLNTLVTGETKVLKTLEEISLVGHRVVHGGADYAQATKITPEVKEAIANLIPLAPAHNPAHLEGIEAIKQVLGDITQIAVFDTAFHQQMPLKAAVYPLPYEWYEKGIRRYGFHGTSHKYCAQRAAQLLEKPLESLKIVTCHLGNGCSLAAIKDGVSQDTTMGFTPLEGLMMGTRSGSIDPAILLYLLREYDFDAAKLNHLLNKESGFKGVSGISADLRSIKEAIATGNQRAQLALDIFIHRLRAAIGAMIANLGGLDILVFTAGIGENAAIVREKACADWEFIGLKLDCEKNIASPVDEDLATADSHVRIFIVHTEEDWAIATECWQLQLKENLIKSDRC
jgi:acetate kinase